MKLNWFSPLPPAASGVAEYVWQVLPELTRWAEVTAWTRQEVWDERLEDLVRVRRIEADFWPQVNRGALSIFHLGNNPDFHAEIWERSRAHPGVVVLHDVSLQHLFASLFLEVRKDGPGYVAAMARCHGDAGRQVAEALVRGAFGYRADVMLRLAARFPMTRMAVEASLGVMVHSRAGFEALVEPLRCPIAWSGLPLDPRRSPPVRSKAPGQPRRLLVFGHIGPNRRLSQVLEALADLDQRERFRLEIYGHVWNLPAFQGVVERLGIGHLVRFRGFVAQPELEEALANSDLAINLRYPTMGEASLTQLMIWRAALPSLVTAADWYEEVAEGAVGLVRPEHEHEDLRHHLISLLEEPDRFSRMGERGREHLSTAHSPELYARQLIDLAAAGMAFRPTAEAFRMARLAAERGRAWTTESGRAHLDRRVADEVMTLFDDPVPAG